MSAKSISQLATRIANHAWRKDGKPERDRAEPTSVGYGDYRRHALWVLGSLQDMGFTIDYPKRAPTGTSQENQQ